MYKDKIKSGKYIIIWSFSKKFKKSNNPVNWKLLELFKISKNGIIKVIEIVSKSERNTNGIIR